MNKLYTEKNKHYDSLIRNKTKDYFNTQIKNSDNKSKTCWSIVHSILGKSAKNVRSISENENCSEEFGNYLENTVSRIINNIDCR